MYFYSDNWLFKWDDVQKLLFFVQWSKLRCWIWVNDGWCDFQLVCNLTKCFINVLRRHTR